MRLLVIVAICGMLTGCLTTEPKVESTKPWENHYMTVEEFYEQTKDITLDKDESIWVLSNHTLNRLLKNTGK